MSIVLLAIQATTLLAIAYLIYARRQQPAVPLDTSSDTGQLTAALAQLEQRIERLLEQSSGQAGQHTDEPAPDLHRETLESVLEPIVAAHAERLEHLLREHGSHSDGGPAIDILPVSEGQLTQVGRELQERYTEELRQLQCTLVDTMEQQGGRLIQAMSNELNASMTQLRDALNQTADERADRTRRHTGDTVNAAATQIIEALQQSVSERATETETVVRDYLDLESEKDRGRAWAEAAHGLQDDEAMELIEAGLLRYPGSHALLEAVLGHYTPLAQEPHDIAMRRHAVIRMNEHLDRFRITCRRPHLAFAKEARAQLDTLAAALVTSAGATYRERLEEQLETLEAGVARVASDSEASLDELARLDEAVDRNGLQNHPDLLERYDRATERLIQCLHERDHADAPDDVEYNRQAMKAAKALWKDFQSNEESGILGKFKDRDFNTSGELDKVAKALGGWDSRRLLPATHTYVTSVYSEIFQKLEPKGRARLTELMIKQPTKE